MSEFLLGGHHSCEILIISCLSVLRNRTKKKVWALIKPTLYFNFWDTYRSINFIYVTFEKWFSAVYTRYTQPYDLYLLLYIICNLSHPVCSVPPLSSSALCGVRCCLSGFPFTVCLHKYWPKFLYFVILMWLVKFWARHSQNCEKSDY
jgi:hypothetical protein